MTARHLLSILVLHNIWSPQKKILQTYAMQKQDTLQYTVEQLPEQNLEIDTANRNATENSITSYYLIRM